MKISKYLRKKLLGSTENLNVQKVDYRKSYSQCGEDILIDYIFSLRGVSQPSYLDIGAHHPYYLNNTALFYDKGCRGINVEANPKLFDEFLIHRVGDKNLNIGVGKEEGLLDFYIMQDSTLSTFSEEESARIQKAGTKLLGVEKIKIVTINEIIGQHNDGIFPDFLTLDVEGVDLMILQTIDFTKTVPKVICVEAAEYSNIGAGKRRDDIIDFLRGCGYYEYANTNLNAIMVKQDFWFI